jgi:hypothetical protein
MSDGWKILNRKVDNYDMEWEVFKDLIGNYWYCFFAHIVSGEIFRLFKLKVRDCVYVIDNGKNIPF